MKVAAKPMGLPSSSQVTEKKLKKTEAGKKTLEFIQDAIKNGFMPYKSSKEYLKHWSKKERKKGTCVGQACAAIIAKGRQPDKSEKSQIKKANIVESIAFQILVNLHGECKAYSSEETIKKIAKGLTKIANKELKKIPKKMAKLKKKGSKKHSVSKKIKKLKKEEKEFVEIKKDPIKMVNKNQKKLNTLKLPRSENERAQYKKFSEKVGKAYRDQIEKKTNLKFVEQEKFSNSKKFYGWMKELLEEKKPASLLVMFNPKKGGAGHAIALFIDKQSTMYDSNEGLTKPLQLDKFKKLIRETVVSEFSDYQFDHGYGKLKFEVDVFKQK